MSRKGENIHKRKDGRWEGRYKKGHDAAGKSIYGSVYARTYSEVKRKLAEINIRPAAAPYHPTESKKTLREVLYLWLENSRIKLKPQTYANYQYMIETHIIPLIGSVMVHQIDAKYLNSFILDKSLSGRLDGKGGLSASYIKKITFIINSTLTFAMKENLCPPMRSEVFNPPKKKSELEILTIGEQSILEKYICHNFVERDLSLLLSLYVGLRLGEVCGLMWQDFDFEAQTIHVRRTVERIRNLDAIAGESKTVLLCSDVKTISSNRIIPIPSRLLPILKKCRKSDETFIIKGCSYPYSDPRTIQYFFGKRLKECGIKNRNYHALRHTFATRCVESGMEIKSLSEILGHANVNITLNTYVHSTLDHKRIQLENMSSFCGQENGQVFDIVP